MKVSYVSDLHLDFWAKHDNNEDKWKYRTVDFINKLIDTDEDDKEVICIVGDFGHFNKQSLWALEVFSQYYEQVFFVTGNHDYYLVSKNQENKYNNHSQHRIKELYIKSLELANNIHPLLTDATFTYKGITFGGNPLWYPIESPEQQMFFNNISNDSNYIKGINLADEHHLNQQQYSNLLKKDIEVMISHFPVININSHFKHNSTACYLTPVKDIKVKHWIMAHSHEQKVYEKPYCTFYMNAIGYPEEKLELSIKSFEI